MKRQETGLVDHVGLIVKCNMTVKFLIKVKKKHGVSSYALLEGKITWTQHQCLDCSFEPVLCQTVSRDCHHKRYVLSFEEPGNTALPRSKEDHKVTS